MYCSCVEFQQKQLLSEYFGNKTYILNTWFASQIEIKQMSLLPPKSVKPNWNENKYLVYCTVHKYISQNTLVQLKHKLTGVK